MDTDTAIKIIKDHNLWRRGKHDTMTDVTILGLAIDEIIRFYEAPKRNEEIISHAKQALGLFSSMVSGGEEHSKTSRDIFYTTMTELDELENRLHNAK